MLALLRQRNFGLLWFASLISLAGDWMLVVALPIYVYEMTGSTLATSAMLIVKLLPNLLLGSVAGVFVDRWDRRRTMVVANLLLAVSLLPILAVHSADQLWLLYAAALAESTLIQFMRPAKSATLPNLVAEDELVTANALNALNNNLARLLGPAVGGVLAGWLGLTGVTVLDIISYAVAAGLIALIVLPQRTQPVDVAGELETAWVRTWRDWVAGLRLVRHEAILLLLFVSLGITAIGEGIMGTLFVPYVTDILRGGTTERGWLLSAQAVGGLLGGLVVSRLGQRFALHQMIGWGCIAFGLLDLAIFNYPLLLPSVLPGIILMVLVGIPGVFAMTAVETVLQRATADEYRGRVYGALGTSQSLTMMAGAAVAGALGPSLGTITLLNVQGGGYIVAGLLALFILSGLLAQRPWAERPTPEPVAEGAS